MIEVNGNFKNTDTRLAELEKVVQTIAHTVYDGKPYMVLEDLSNPADLLRIQELEAERHDLLTKIEDLENENARLIDESYETEVKVGVLTDALADIRFALAEVSL